MKKEKRFEVLSNESIGIARGVLILLDRQTGVQYLFVQDGYSGGLTPLLDKDGKPVVGIVAK